MPTLELLEQHSIPEPNSGCWLWLRGVNSGGYASQWWKGRQWRASHLALMAVGVDLPVKTGRGPGALQVLHRCDNTYCVNPDHLFVGTVADNMRDSIAKGRKPYLLKEFCKHGHLLSGDNLYIHPSTGKRFCRSCRKRLSLIAEAKRRPRKR